MKNKKHNTKIGTIFGFIINSITVLSFLGVTFATVVSFITKNWWWMLLILAIPAFIFLIMTIRKTSVALVKFIIRLFSINNKYKFNEFKATYEYVTPCTMKYRSEYLVKAKQSGVDNIRLRLNWSGSCSSEPLHPKPMYKARTITETEDEFGYTTYKLEIPSINANDKPIKAGVKLDSLTVDKVEPKKHLKVGISVVTDNLVMKVIFPRNLEPINVEFLEYLHFTDDNHWHRIVDVKETKPVYRANRKQYVLTWSIKKPVFGGKYIIKWDFKNNMS